MTMTLPTCAPPDPGDRGPSFDIVRCNEASHFKLDFYSLSEAVVGFDVHWSYGKTHVCTLPWGRCKRCHAGAGKRWVGYLAAMDELKAKRFLVEVTPGVMPMIRTFLEGRKSLRGRLLRLLRKSRHKCGPLSIEFRSEAFTLPDDQCPEPFDVEGVLAKIYNLEKDTVPDKKKPEVGTNVVDEFLSRATMDSVTDVAQKNLSAADQADRLAKYSANGKH